MSRLPLFLSFRPRGGGLPALACLVATGLLSGPACGHEPVFGLGPHTIYKGGVGIEVELEGDRTSGSGETEEDHIVNTEILYGLTADLSVTVAMPTFLDREARDGGETVSASGLGDLSLRAKYRFWRRDLPGIQDAAAVILGVKFPTGDDDASPRLGSGSTDYLFGLATARESLRWYYFGDLRYRLNTEGANDLNRGDRLFADVAIGIRPHPAQYLRPDLVLLAELNWETWMRDGLGGVDLADSGGDRLFLSPGFFFTYRNWAAKGGVQIPVHLDLNGDQPEDDYRFHLAVEVHL